MIKDEIENKIQLETININKTIANKRRGTKLKEKNKLKGWPRKKEKEKKEIKKKKSNFDPNHIKITIHAPPIKEDDAEMNQMMWQDHDYNCQS
jgi:hypothetical protein